MAITDNFVPNVNTTGVARSSPPQQTLTDDGAITIADGIVFLNKGSAIAATIDDPPTNMDGAILKIVSLTAQAHTLTYTAGFGGGTTARDVATWGGAISDYLEIVAKSGVWYTLSLDGVSLG